MHLIDKVMFPFAPQAVAKRMRARNLVAAYEAVKPTRTRKNPADNASGDSLTEYATDELRGQARHLDQNHDLAVGILNTLVNNTVGANGIDVEAQPKTLDGDIHEEFAEQLQTLWEEWCKRPECTRQFDWPKAQRLLCLSWFRDGEVLIKELYGHIAGLKHGTAVPYSLELLEADFLPTSYNDPHKNIVQGVELSAWGQPTFFHLLKSHPGGLGHSFNFDTRRVPADRLLHIKMVRRLHQRRGVSVFSAVMNRLNDIKDYEESERVAARISAAMTAYIKKGSPDDYDDNDSEDGERAFSISPGMVFDDLQPGEDVGILESNRPSALLQPFRDAMLKAVASGTGAGASSISKNYDGSYSSQRQEMVEQWGAYKALSNEFTNYCVRPVWERFVQMAVLGGQVVIPANLDRKTLLNADYIPPVMPWIDPLKEIKADKESQDSLLESPQRIIRRRGGNPRNVLDQAEKWRKELHKRGLLPEQLEVPPDEGGQPKEDDDD